MSKKNQTPKTENSAIDLAMQTMTNPKADPSSRLYAQYIIAKDSNPNRSDLEICDELNEDSKRNAIATIVNAEGVVDWYAFLLGVTYPVLDLEKATDPTSSKELRVSDFLALKANKKSAKLPINGQLYSLLDMFGANICTEYHQTRETSELKALVYLSKYTTDLDGFKAENPQSVGSMEKQLQTICNTLFGADRAPKVRKAHVRHLSDKFNRATKTGYSNGNAITLLQEVVNHARDAKSGIKYEVKGRLECQKEDKPKK